jgi:hypothetical protein
MRRGLNTKQGVHPGETRRKNMEGRHWDNTNDKTTKTVVLDPVNASLIKRFEEISKAFIQ